MKMTRGLWGMLTAMLVLLTGLLGSTAEAATISGTVNNNSGKTGSRVYLSVTSQFGGDAMYGVSIPTPGPHASASYSIRGVPDGTYVVQAFLDSRSNTSATRHANDPFGSSQPVNITGGNEATANIVLNPPAPAVALEAPALNGVLPGPGVAMVVWDTPQDPNGFEIAYSYNVYWHTDSTVSPSNYTGKKNGIPARDDGMYFQTKLDPVAGTPLADGTTLWYVVTGQFGVYGQVGSTEGPVSNTFGPVVIGAMPSSPGSSYNVSGTINIDNGITPAGPLLIAVFADGPNMRLGKVGSPVAGANSFTVTGVPDGEYQVYSLIDQNNDGNIWAGDYTVGDKFAPSISVSGADVAGIVSAIPKEDVEAAVATSHYIDVIGQEGYGLNFNVSQAFQLPVNVAVQPGQDVAGPVDLALSSWGDFSYWINNVPRPAPGTEYTLNIGYANGSTANLQVAVTAVLDSFPEPIAPTGSVTFNPTPEFSWAPPVSPPAGGYSYSLNLNGNNLWWNPDWLHSSQTQATFNFDGQASQSALTDNTLYTWEIGVNDLNGNQARKSAIFFSGGSISGTVNGADTGSGVAGISVQLYDGNGVQLPWQYNALTSASGSFIIGGLQTGTYRVCFYVNQTGYVNQCYDNKNFDSSQATNIAVTSPNDSVLDPVTLVKAASISGTVSAAGGGPIQGVFVELRDVNGNWVSGQNQAQTDASGNYSLRGFPAGSYKLYFNGSSQGYIGQWYDGKNDAASADTITLSDGKSQTADAALVQGGSITGIVTDSVSHNGIQGINVQLYDQSGMWIPTNGNMTTDADGSYTVGGLASGTYKICFHGGSSSYIGKCYDDLVMDPWNATPIAVTAPATTAGINAALVAGGTISGQVTNGVGGIQLVNIQLRDVNGNWIQGVSGTSTDQNGNYTLGGVPAGTYKVYFDGAYAGYIGRWYDGGTGAATLGSALSLTLAAGETKTNIGAVLPLGGSIAGQVTDSITTAPIAGINVQLYDGSGSWLPNFPSAPTDGSGNYRIAGLPDGSYKVCFSSGSTSYLAKCYDNLPANPATATPITIAASNSVTGRDITLVLGATLNGRVTHTGTGVVNVGVELRDTDGATIPDVFQAITNASGDYSLRGVPAGTYKVYFNTGGTGYLPQWYDGKSSVTSATSVTVANGDVRNAVNASLVQGGTISGRVLSETSQPLVGSLVQLWDTNSTWINATVTDQGGNYTFGGLAAGNYRVQFDGFGPYLGQWYNDKQTPETANTVAVSAGATTSLSDAVLKTNLQVAVTVSADKTSPQLVGTSINVTAAAQGGSGSYEYRFWLYNGTAWTLAQDYGNGATWAMPATTPAGSYTIAVDVRTSSAVYRDAVAYLGFEVTAGPAIGVTITPGSPNPYTVAGTAVAFTAAGQGSANYDYRFWLFDGTNWIQVQNYGNGAVWTMPGSTPIGNYVVAVDVRTTSAVDRDTVAYLGFDVSSGPASGVDVTPSQPAPHAPGTSVDFVASGLGSANYDYRFWLYDGTTWTLVQNYGAGAVWTMPATTLVGDYIIAADVRTSSTVDRDTVTYVSYSIQ